MADIETRLDINVDTSGALANIKALQRQISALHQEISKGGAQASAKAFNLQQNFINNLNASGKFSASLDNITTSTESFTQALEKNKMSMGQYFKYAGGASKSFGKFFKTEMDTVSRVAIERVKDLQTQYIKMGRDANGAMKAIKVRPLTLDMNDLGTKTALAAQKQQLLNQLLKQGSTAMLNWGKNTQWAGRQLMVGFTIPLGMLGTQAAKVFADMEKQAIAFKRVYGDSFTPQAETNAMLKQVQDLATEFTKYGVAVSDTMGLAAKAAATGKTGADLLAQTTQAARLSVLGQVDQQKALETTMSIQNAFGISTKDLGTKINFLNAVENQTITSIDDLTTAIPKAGPVIKQLGGNVEDLSFFLTAMKEGGINASEGANALKSGLASLINPTNKASKMLEGFGINVKQIVAKNAGNVKGIVIDFAKALDKLDPLNRARAIEQMFGKFQFSRLSTLFQNVVKDGSQASRVLDLTNKSSIELATIANRELRQMSSSPLYQFQKAIEDFKKELAPVGEQFMKAVTPLINFGTDILKNFNSLGDGTKQFIVNFTGLFAGLGPILLMTFGLIANGVANVIKGFAFVKGVFNKASTASTTLGETTNYMTTEQIKAASVAASLEQVHNKLTQQFTVERESIDLLTQSYQRLISSQGGTPLVAPTRRIKRSTGGFVSGPGTGTSDSIPALLSNGEFVINAKSAKAIGQSELHKLNNVGRFAYGGPVRRNVFGEGGRTPYQIKMDEERKALRLKQRDEAELANPALKEARLKKEAEQQKAYDKNNPKPLAFLYDPRAAGPLTADSPVAKRMTRDQFAGKILFSTDKSAMNFLVSPEYLLMRSLGLKAGRYEVTHPGKINSLEEMYDLNIYSPIGTATKTLKNARAKGIINFANGGHVFGAGSSTSDSIPAMLSNGEFVINAKSAKAIGRNNLNRLNGYAQGGDVLETDLTPSQISEAKRKSGLFKAPAQVRKQTVGMSWDTLDSERRAVIKAVGGNVSEMQLGNLLQKQASHIQPDVSDVNVGGIFVQVKNWLSKNLVPDLGYVNNYLNSLQTSSKILDNFSKSDIDTVAKKLGISAQEVQVELDNLRKGIHPTTRKGAEILKAVAATDNGYQAKAVVAGLKERLSGDYYETMGQRKYDPSKDAPAAKTTLSRLKLFSKKIFNSSQSLPQATENIIIDAVTNKIDSVDKSIVEAAKKRTKTASPSREAEKLGENIGQGALNGMNNKVDDAKNIGEKIGQVIVDGTRRGASSGGVITPTQSGNFELANGRQRTSRRATSGPGYFENGRFIPVNQYGDAIAPGISNVPYGPEALTPEQSKQIKQYNRKQAISKIKNMTAAEASAKFGGKTSGAMFGISMVAGAASMMGGPIGDVAGIVSMVAGPLSMFGGTIAKIIPLLIRFAGPIGIAITAISGLSFIISALTENERKKLEQSKKLAESTNLTADKMQSIAEFFGVSATATAKIQNSTAGTTSSLQAAVDELKMSESFKTQFASTIDQLKTGTSEQDRITISNIMTKMLPDYSKEQIKVVIEALKQESGKTGLSVNYGDAISLAGGTLQKIKMPTPPKNPGYENTEEGRKKFEKDNPTLSKNEADIKFQQMQQNYMNDRAAYNVAKEQTKLTPQNIEDIKIYSNTLKTEFDSISASLANGKVTTKEYQDKIDELKNSLKSLDPTVASKSIKEFAILLGMKPEDAQLIYSIKDVDKQFLFVQASITNGTQALSDWKTMIENAPDTDAYKAALADLQALANVAVSVTAIGKTNPEELNAKFALDDKKAEKGTGPSQKDKLNAALTLISQKEDKINKKYDDRKKALDDIANIQKQITEQQQQQLDISSALSRGDVAAAARAAQQMRASNATKALENQQKQLEKSRQNELAAVKDPLGRTRDQIQSKLDKITTQEAKDTMAGKGGTPGKAAVDGGDLAHENMKTNGYTDENLKLQGMKWDNSSGHWRIVLIPQVPSGTYIGPGGSGKGPQKQATGGYITGPGTGTSDSIPTMLSNGEYVIKASSVKKIGIGILNKINNGELTKMSKSNYPSISNENISSKYGSSNNINNSRIVITINESMDAKATVNEIMRQIEKKNYQAVFSVNGKQ